MPDQQTQDGSMYTWARSEKAIRVARVREAHFAWAPAYNGITFLSGRNFETRIPSHVHSTYVLGVVDEGAVEVIVRGESYLATTGAVIAFQPFQAHAEFAASETGWSFRYLYPTEALVRHALGSAGADDAVGLRFRQPVIEDASLGEALGSTYDRLAAGRPNAETEPLLADLFQKARARHCAPLDPRIASSRTRTGVRLARRMIVESALRRLTTTDLADAAGVSPFHFNRVFHDEVGLPPYAYYEQVRIARAHDMILAGQPLTAVAYVLGFSDQAHFTRHFHRASILTPGQYATISRGLITRDGPDS
jgi:AraC-like DNA-binding protein